MQKSKEAESLSLLEIKKEIEAKNAMVEQLREIVLLYFDSESIQRLLPKIIQFKKEEQKYQTLSKIQTACVIAFFASFSSPFLLPETEIRLLSFITIMPFIGYVILQSNLTTKSSQNSEEKDLIIESIINEILTDLQINIFREITPSVINANLLDLIYEQHRMSLPEKRKKKRENYDLGAVYGVGEPDKSGTDDSLIIAQALKIALTEPEKHTFK